MGAAVTRALQLERTEPFARERGEIVRRLRARRSEIVHAILARIRDDVPDQVGQHNRAYHDGVRSTVGVVIDYSLDAIEQGSDGSAPIPPQAVAQARLAARTGVSLGIVVRRYVAGHGELGDFVIQETQASRLSSNEPAVHHIRKVQETVLSRLTAAIEREYEHERGQVDPDQRRADVVQSLLQGDALDPTRLAELDYEIRGCWHLGLIAIGDAAAQTLNGLKTRFGRRLLTVSVDGRALAWLGGQDPLTPGDVNGLRSARDDDVLLAIGEPGRNIDGFRLTHHQAMEALGLALNKPDRFARYADDPLLAAIVANDTFAKSLTQKYLTPLRGQKDGGAILIHTLRTYIALECNAASAAHPLKLKRRAVANRIRLAEKVIGSPIRGCLAELDAALRLHQLEQSAPTHAPPD